MNDDNLREELAAREHEQWAEWILFLDKLRATLTPEQFEENLKRWSKQAQTPYEQLSESEKDSDRRFADNVLSLVLKDRGVTISFLLSESKRVQDSKGHRIAWARRDPNADLNPMEAISMLCEEAAGEMLPEYRSNNKEHFGRELAGLVLRCFHLAADLEIPLEKLLIEEMNYNETRPYRHGRAMI